MSESYSELLNFLGQFPDAMRHPLCVDNPDWERIGPALVEYVETAGKSLECFDLCTPVLQCLAQSIYLMGYERGKMAASKAPLTMIVAEEA